MTDRPTPEQALEDKPKTTKSTSTTVSGTRISTVVNSPFSGTDNTGVAVRADNARQRAADAERGEPVSVISEILRQAGERPTIQRNRDFTPRETDFTKLPLKERLGLGTSRLDLALDVEPIFQSRGEPNPYLIQRPETPAHVRAFWREKTTQQIIDMIQEDPTGVFSMDTTWQGPANFTELELMSLDTGVMPGNLDILQAQQVLWDSNADQRHRLLQGFNTQLVRFEESSIWQQVDEEFVKTGMIPAELMNGLALMTPQYVDPNVFERWSAQMLASLHAGGLPGEGRERDIWFGFWLRQLWQSQEIEQDRERARIIAASGGGIQQWGFGPMLVPQQFNQLDQRHPTQEYSPHAPFVPGQLDWMDHLDATSQPLDDFARGAGDALSRMWAHLASDPDEPYRARLSLGQNVAISFGQDPGTVGYRYLSGGVDAAVLLGLDPLNAVAGAGAISKVLRTGVKAAKPTIRSVLSAAKPFNHMTTLGGSKVRGGPIGRVMFEIFGRTVDDMAASPDFLWRMEQMRDAAASGSSVARLAEDFPELQGSLETFHWLASTGATKEDLAFLWKVTAKGEIQDHARRLQSLAEGEVLGATDELTQLVTRLLDEGQMGIEDLAGMRLGTDGKKTVSAYGVIYGLNDAGVGRRSEFLRNEGVRVHAWVEEPNVLDLRNKEHQDLRNELRSRVGDRREHIEITRYRQEDLVEEVEITRGRVEDVQITGFQERAGLQDPKIEEQLVEQPPTGQSQLFDTDPLNTSDRFGQLPQRGQGNLLDPLEGATETRRMRLVVDPDDVLRTDEFPRAVSDVTRPVDVPYTTFNDELVVGQVSWPVGQHNIIKSMPNTRFKNLKEVINDPDWVRLNKLRQEADRMGFDMVRDGSNVIVTRRGRKKLVEGVDQRVSMANEELDLATRRYAIAQIEWDKFKNLTAERYFVDPTLPGEGAGWYRFSRNVDRALARTGPLANPLRRSWAWASNPLPPAQRLSDRQATRSVMRSMAIHGDISEKTLEKFYRRLEETTDSDLRQFWDEWLTAIAEESDDIGTKLGIWNFIDEHKQRTYVVDDSGKPLVVGASGSRGGRVVSAQPHRPEYLTDMAIVPNVFHYKQAGRLRRAKSLQRLGGGSLVRGFGKTKTRRRDLVDAFKAKVKAKSPMDLDALELSDDDWYALAFSQMAPFRDIGDGLGIISKIMREGGTMWNEIRATFNIFQLALNPVRWMFKVVGIEEQTRGQLAGLAGLYGHPIRRIGIARDALAMRQVDGFHAGMNAGRQNAINAIVDPLIDFRDRGKGKDWLLRELSELWEDAPIEKLSKLDVEDIPGAVRREVNDAFRNRNVEAFSTYMSEDQLKAWTRMTKAQERLVKRYGPGVVELTDELYDDIYFSDFYKTATDDFLGTPDGNIPLVPEGNAFPGAKHFVDALQHELSSSWGRQALKFRRNQLRGNEERIKTELMRFTRREDWTQMRPTVEDVISYELGVDATRMSDLELAEAYFDNTYNRILDHYLDSHYTKGTVEELEVLESIIKNRELPLRNGGRISTEVNGGGVQAYRNWWENNSGNLWFNEPRVAKADVNPHGVFGEPLGGWRNLYRPMRATRRALAGVTRVMGSKASAELTRKPMFLELTRQWTDHYTSLGVDPKMAVTMAKGRAAETINDLMYNMDNSTQMLLKFNQVVPFGAAMVEVAKVWLWDLPVKHLGGVGAGHLSLMHRLKRFEEAAVSAGIAEWQPQDPFDKESKRDSLVFYADTDQIQKGDFLKEGVWALLTAYEALGNGLGNLRSWIYQEEGAESDITSDAERPDKTRKEFHYGLSLAPFRPFDAHNHGLMALTNIAFGQTPLTNWTLNKIAEIPAIAKIDAINLLHSKNVQAKVEPGDNLISFASENGIKVEHILMSMQNVEILERYPEFMEAVEAAQEADEPWWEIPLPEGILLDIPNTNNFHLLYEQFMNPFGRTEDFPDVIRNFVPNPIQQFFKAMGINQGSFTGEDMPAWAQAPTLLARFLGPNNLYDNDSGPLRALRAVLSQPMEHGDKEGKSMLVAMDEVFQEMVDIEAQLFQDGLADYTDDDEFFLLKDENGAFDPGALEKYRLWERLRKRHDAMSDAAIERAMHIYGQEQFTKALSGWLLPTTPRSFDYETEAAGAFWLGVDVINYAQEQKLDGVRTSLDEIAQLDNPDLQTIAFETVSDWLYDRSSSSSELKQAFAERYPHLRSYVQSHKIYNGPLFVSGPGLQEYLDQLERGDIKVMTPQMFIMRNHSTALTWKHLTERKATFGTDEDGNYLSDAEMMENIVNGRWQEYSELNDKHYLERQALMAYDVEFMDGEYTELRRLERAASDHQTDQEAWEQAQLDANLAAVQADLATIGEDLRDLDDLWKTDPNLADLSTDVLLAEQRRMQAIRDKLRAQKEQNFWSEFDEMLFNFFNRNTEYTEAKASIHAEIKELGKLDERTTQFLYDNLRMRENEEYRRKYIGPGGVSLPNYVEWTKQFYDEERIERKVWQTLGRPVEWWSQRDIDWVQEYASVDISPYLPTTRGDWDIYEWRNQMLNAIKAQAATGFDEDGEPYTLKQVGKDQDAVKEAVIKYLKSEGRETEAQFWEEYTPFDRLGALGILPEGLEPLVALGQDLRQHIAQKYGPKKTIRGNDAKLYWRQVTWPAMSEYLRTNPDLINTIEQMGTMMRSDDDVRKMLWYLSTGDRSPFGE